MEIKKSWNKKISSRKLTNSFINGGEKKENDGEAVKKKNFENMGSINGFFFIFSSLSFSSSFPLSLSLLVK